MWPQPYPPFYQVPGAEPPPPSLTSLLVCPHPHLPLAVVMAGLLLVSVSHHDVCLFATTQVDAEQSRPPMPPARTTTVREETWAGVEGRGYGGDVGGVGFWGSCCLTDSLILSRAFLDENNTCVLLICQEALKVLWQETLSGPNYEECWGNRQ